MDWNIIVATISLAFSLIAIIFGLKSLEKLGGRLRIAVLFLIFTFGAIVVKEILFFFNLFGSMFVGFGLRILMTLFVFLAMINILWMIKAIDGEYKRGEYKNVIKREKQEKQFGKK